MAKATGGDNIPVKAIRPVAGQIGPSVAYLFNESFNLGSFPSSWKIARVSPLFKGGDPSDRDNQRPISVLPFLSKTEAHQDTLVSEQASFILERSGIGTIYNIIQDQAAQKAPLSLVNGMDEQSVKDSMSKFDKYLSSPDSLVLPQVDLLRSTRLRDTVNKRSSDLVCVAYRKIYDAVLNPFNRYNEPKSIAVRTPDQVSSLLS